MPNRLFSPIRLGIKALDITTALNMFQCMASVKLSNKLTDVSKLWGFLAFRHFTAVNASLLLLGSPEVLEDDFSRASQGLSQRQCSGEERAGTWFARV